MNRRVLLVGATGVFGSRLALLLAAKPGLQLILAARSLASLSTLQAVIKACNPSTEIAVIDRRRPDLRASLPWLVIDAAGPFQESDYTLAREAIRVGAHYVDLADARGFVAGFPREMQAAANEAGVLAVTGASSTPALSHAALHRLTSGWQRLDEVTVVISPGARAPRGRAVIEAILSYVGRPVRVFRDGAWGAASGWSLTRRLYMPGLGLRWASLCETPDLDLLPERFPIQRTALFLAGLELASMHLGLAILSRLVRWRLLSSLRPLARVIRAVANVLAPFGTDRGGMVVEAIGKDAEGQSIHARWALWAEANAGPYTPAAPAAALVAALHDGRETRRGAFSCAGLLKLDDIMAELAAFPIWTRADEGHPDSPVLFRRLLGRRFDLLPFALRSVHGSTGTALFTGKALARAGTSPPARLVRLLVGLPKSGWSEAAVRITPDRLGETWARRFGNARFSSRLVSNRQLELFAERFGPVKFKFELHATPSGVAWRLVGWRVLGVRLPLSLGPQVHARADEVGGRYQFRVAVAHRLTGLLFAYRGKLDVQSVADASLGPTLCGHSHRPYTTPSTAARPKPNL